MARSLTLRLGAGNEPACKRSRGLAHDSSELYLSLFLRDEDHPRLWSELLWTREAALRWNKGSPARSKASEMRSVILHIVRWLSISSALVCVLWLVAVSMSLLATGGTYSRSYPNGVIACQIPVFTEDYWFWPMFRLYGVPLFILLASMRTIGFCAERRKLARQAQSDF